MLVLAHQYLAQYRFVCVFFFNLIFFINFSLFIITEYVTLLSLRNKQKNIKKSEIIETKICAIEWFFFVVRKEFLLNCFFFAIKCFN